MQLLLIFVFVILIFMLFAPIEYFTPYIYCDWHKYETDKMKCPSGYQCANMGICRSDEDCNTFPLIKCK